MGVGTAHQPKYRADIDGLRAVSVLAVVAYHAFPEWMPGGFVGVDVFFVISGFLISTILFENFEWGTFSFLDFYTRRVRRIFPALLPVLLFTFGFGWFVLLPNEYESLGRHIAGAATFIPNFTLWNEAGYFDTFSGRKPLLHLWSLGIEEQFYLVWPPLLWISHKIKLPLFITIVSLASASFYLNIHGIQADKTATFFSPQTRMWELSCGGLLAWLQFRRTSRAPGWVSMIGFLLLAVCFWQLDSNTPYPGLYALGPVLSAVLMIAGERGWVNRVLLSNRVAVAIGLISYPLYLWHWPLLSFARTIEGQAPALGVRVSLIVCSFLLSWVTYEWLELPMRFGKHARFKAAGLIVGMAALFGLGRQMEIREGYAGRAFARNNSVMQTGLAGGKGSYLLGPDCGVEDPVLKARLEACGADLRGTPRYALLGDSKATALMPGLLRTSLPNGRWLVIGGNNGTGPVLPVLSDWIHYQEFQELTRAALEAAAKNPTIEKVVFVSAVRSIFLVGSDTSLETLDQSPFYPAALAGLKASIEYLTRAGKSVVIVVDNPALPYPEDCLHRKIDLPFINAWLKQEKPECHLSIAVHERRAKKYRELLTALQKSFPDKLRIFETWPYLCDETAGVCTVMKNGRFLYGRSDHISDYGADLVGKELNAFLASY